MIRAYRAELLSVGQDPRGAPDAVRHEPDGLLVIEDGIVIARGPYADLADQYAGIEVETLPGLVVPGFVDAHVHYPQTDRIASHGEQLLDWLDRHIFPAEKAFVDKAHADGVAAFFLDELLRNGTTSALVYPTVHEQSVDALFALLARDKGVMMHTHLAENVRECAAVEERFSDAVDYLDAYDRFGLVTSRSVFAHGIHLSDRACGRLHESGAGIAICPSSNLFLGSGFFNFGKADAHKVRLGLGTDIGAGTSFSMLYTAGLAYQAALAREDKLDPFRALYLATAGSAALLQIADKVGALEPGQEADFVVLDCGATPLLARRTLEADLAERLFAMQILGDDRVVARTYVLGQCAWQRTSS